MSVYFIDVFVASIARLIVMATYRRQLCHRRHRGASGASILKRVSEQLVASDADYDDVSVLNKILLLSQRSITVRRLSLITLVATTNEYSSVARIVSDQRFKFSYTYSGPTIFCTFMSEKIVGSYLALQR